MTVRTAPCAWPLDTTCCTAAWEAASPELQATATAVATELLWRLTGRRFGTCPITLRPCRKSCAEGRAGLGSYGAGGWAPPYTPFYEGGSWFNMACGQCIGECGCSTMCEIALPGPVHQVTSVKINGMLVPADEYVVHDHRTLVRLGDDCWPTCQDLAADPDDVNGTAFAVSYLQGVPVPIGGQVAAGMYACEFVKACTRDNSCRLPKRVTRITREGVSLDFLDPMTFLDEGLTGLPEVDVWVRSVNPYRRYERSSVWSVDRMPPRTVTS